jgi:hypothetical protein
VIEREDMEREREEFWENKMRELKHEQEKWVREYNVRCRAGEGHVFK